MPIKTEIHQYDSEGNRIGVFESTKSMAIETGYSTNAIRQCLLGKRLSLSGMIYLLEHHWTEETAEEEVLRRISLMTEADKEKEEMKAVVCFDEHLQLTEYKSIHSASEALGIRVMDIKRNCEGSAFALKEWCFYYKEDIPEAILPFVRSVQAKFMVLNQRNRKG